MSAAQDLKRRRRINVKHASRHFAYLSLLKEINERVFFRFVLIVSLFLHRAEDDVNIHSIN